jgi:acyl-CoA dehydrogenase
VVFPRGRSFSSPRDSLARRIVEGVISPGEMRDGLCEGVYRTVEPGNHLGLLQEAMELSIEVAPLEKKLRKGVKEGKIRALGLDDQIEEAVSAGLLTADEAQKLRLADEKVMAIIHVDDFAPEDLSPFVQSSAAQPSGKPARKVRARKSAQEAAEPTEA